MDIKEEVIADEIGSIASELGSRANTKRGYWRSHLNGRFFFVGDDSPFCDYLMSAYARAHSKRPYVPNPIYVFGFGDEPWREARRSLLKRRGIESMMWNKLKFAKVKNDVFFLLLDCRRMAGDVERYVKILEEIDRKRGRGKLRLAIGIVMPSVPAYPDGLQGLAEREYGYYLERIAERTPEIDAYLRFESAVRAFQQKKGRRSAYIVRFSNLLAPDYADTADIAFGRIVDEAFASGKVCVSDADAAFKTGVTTMRGACRCMDMMLYTTRSSGKIYQFYDEAMTVADVKRLLAQAFSDRLAYEAQVKAGVEIRSNVISRMCIGRYKIGTGGSVEQALRRLVNYRIGIPHDNLENVAFYEGRIKAIQRAEIKILKEIDRICRKHGIQYFLAGGTLLGQVRCKGPIPWDDDLDIGMLRQDYEKFKRVVEKELGPEYCYCCPYNDSGSHYTIDKVRLRDSFFSTRYSSANTAKDGIFVDLLVYDQTSNMRWLRKLQLFVLSVITLALEIKWLNRARKNLYYKTSVIFLPLMRLIPFWVFHRTFDWVAKWFMNSKNAKMLIDTVGKKLRAGPMPFKGLKNVMYADFAGIKAPIPADPVPYLTYAFGSKFIEQPILSKRCCPHNFARIDLGRYAFDGDCADDRPVDLRGELFES